MTSKDIHIPTLTPPAAVVIPTQAITIVEAIAAIPTLISIRHPIHIRINTLTRTNQSQSMSTLTMLRVLLLLQPPP